MMGTYLLVTDCLILFLTILNVVILLKIKRFRQIADERVQLNIEAMKKMFGIIHQMDGRLNKLFRVRKITTTADDAENQ